MQLDQRKFLIVVVISIILCNIGTFFLLKYAIKKEFFVSRNIRRADQEAYQKELRHIGQSLFHVSLGRTIDNLIQPTDSPKIRTLKIFDYMASKICNGEDTNLFSFEDSIAMSAYANRAGFCSAKAQLMKKMLYLAGVPSRLFNLYNFGKPGDGHTVLQVWFDNQWHFIDPMLGGYFEDTSGHMLSWSEIQKNPALARKSIKVSNYSCTNFDTNPEQNRSLNLLAVSSFYTLDRINSPFNTAGFHKVDTFRLPARISGRQLPMTLGTPDQTFEDVNKAGVQKVITERLADALNTFHDRFVTDWEFQEVRPDRQYVLEYRFYRQKNMKGAFIAKPMNATVVSGESYAGSDFPEHASWRIVFQPKQAENVHIEISYNRDSMDEGLLVDQIALSEVPPSSQ